MAKTRPSAAVEAARQRRAATAAKQEVRIEWFIKEVSDKIALSAKQRTKIATELTKARVVKNISKPVGRKQGRNSKGQFTKKNIAIRSKPGEFPRADTTLLMKTIFAEVKEIRPGVWDGFVGTPLDYGLILELTDRSFLLRTLMETRGRIRRIMTGPIK